MRIYIVRHGLTEWNKLQKFQGQVNIPLSEEGKLQVLVLKEAIRDLPYDVAYTSPLSRCSEMARMICGDDAEIHEEKLLLEMAFGIYEGASFADRNAYPKDHPLYFYFHDRANYVPPEGAESFPQIMQRAQTFLDKMYAEHPRETILAFSHGAFIRALISQIQLVDQDGKKPLHAPNNCSVTVIGEEDGEFFIEQGPINILAGEKLIF